MATKFRPAPAVAKIADPLIKRHHDHLVGVRIDYLFRDKAQVSKGRPIWGVARKITGMAAYLGAKEHDETREGCDPFFVIEVAEDVWGGLTDKQRTALVDHELAHCAVTVDDEGVLKLSIRGHDLEEFKAIVQRHGLWAPDLQEWQRAIAQLQLDFDGGDDDPDSED